MFHVKHPESFGSAVRRAGMLARKPPSQRPSIPRPRREACSRVAHRVRRCAVALQFCVDAAPGDVASLWYDEASISTSTRRTRMKDLPAHQLDPKVKTVWRINDAIWLTVVFLSCFVPFAIAAMVDPATWMFVVLVAVAVAYAACLIVWLIVLPPIRFMRWRYELSSDYLVKSRLLCKMLYNVFTISTYQN